MTSPIAILSLQKSDYLSHSSLPMLFTELDTKLLLHCTKMDILHSLGSLNYFLHYHTCFERFSIERINP